MYKLKGKFITFEGGEGVGKTTQSKMLVDYLNDNNIEAVWTREPGGCESAEKIRQILLNNENNDFEIMTELSLLYAGRLEHTNKKIKPLLKENKVVVSDRYFDSTTAYQGYGEGIDLNKIILFKKLMLEDFQPDITIVLDLDINEGLKRANKRGEINKFEEMNNEFHLKVRDGFLKIVDENPDRVRKINVSNNDNINDVHLKILKILSN